MTLLSLSTDATKSDMSGRRCSNEVTESRTDCLIRLPSAFKF